MASSLFIFFGVALLANLIQAADVMSAKPLSTYGKQLTHGRWIQYFGDMLLVAELKIGIPQAQAFNVVVDSTTDFCWIAGPSCYTCKSKNPYFPDQHQDFEIQQSDYSASGYFGNVSGDIVTDTFIYNDRKNSLDQPFILAKDVKNLAWESGVQGIDGILGIGFPATPNFPSFVDQLYEQGVIGSKSVSIWFGSSDSRRQEPNALPSTCKLGEPEIETYAPDSEFQYVPVKSGQVELDTIVIGESDKHKVNAQAVLSSFHYPIIGPTDQVNKIYDYFIEAYGSSCSKHENGTQLICQNKSNFPELTFEIGKQKFVLNSMDYCYDHEGFCDLLILGSQDIDHWILGSLMYRGLYTTFDYDNSRIGFARPVESSSTFWVVVVVIIVIVVAIGGIVGYLYWKRKQTSVESEQKDIEQPLLDDANENQGKSNSSSGNLSDYLEAV